MQELGRWGGSTLTLAPTGGADACSKRGAIFPVSLTRNLIAGNNPDQCFGC